MQRYSKVPKLSYFLRVECSFFFVGIERERGGRGGIEDCLCKMVEPKDGERIVQKLAQFSELRPRYDRPPSIEVATSSSNNLLWRFLFDGGFDHLSYSLDPGGRSSQGGDDHFPRHVRRGAKKRAQIVAVVSAVVVAMKSITNGEQAMNHRGTIVDFCGGCGHVGIVLAALLPSWSVVIVDRNHVGLDVAKRRATTACLTNCEMWCGDVGDFDRRFDIGVALHACGAASDLSMAKCVGENAAIVCVPCCVGKIVLRDRDKEVGPKSIQLRGKLKLNGESCRISLSGVCAVDGDKFSPNADI